MAPVSLAYLAMLAIHCKIADYLPRINSISAKPVMRPRIKTINVELTESLANANHKFGRAMLAENALWKNLVGNSSVIELEIGSGKGLFLQSASEQRPGNQFIGIELAAKFADRAAQRLTAAELGNVVMLQGDAEAFVRDKVPAESVTCVHVYFPDPWWRRKHKKRRVLNEDSLHHIQRVLTAGGQFHFWTDVLDYYELICGFLMDHTELIGPQFVPERTPQHDMDYTTHFERRARRHGQPIYRAIFTKAATVTDNRPR